MRGRPANEEMVQGYLDGWDLDNPEPSDNRSWSYRHGFANARDDRRGKPRASFQEISQWAGRRNGDQVKYLGPH